jgi:hypothetical protein
VRWNPGAVIHCHAKAARSCCRHGLRDKSS